MQGQCQEPRVLNQAYDPGASNLQQFQADGGELDVPVKSKFCMQLEEALHEEKRFQAATEDDDDEADDTGTADLWRKYYDLVVKIDSFESIIGQGWEVYTDIDKMNVEGEEDDAIRFCILGDFKKGKTWLLSKLCGEELPDDSVMNTPGLCWKRLTLDEKSCILMDSKGENSPVRKIDNKTLNDRRIEEYVSRDVLSRMADAFIFMVSSLGSHEQEKLETLCGQLAQTKPHTHVFVIHNLREIETEEDFNNAIKQIGSCHDAQGFAERALRVYGDDNTQGEVLTFQKPVTDDELFTRVAQIHFVLGKEGTPAGRKNHLVISNLRSRLLTFHYSFHAATIIDELKSAIERVVVKYLASDTQIIQSAELQVVTSRRKVPMIRLNADVLDTTSVHVRDGFVEPFVPKQFGSGDSEVPYRIMKCQMLEQDKMTEKIKVQIKLPGYSETQLREDVRYDKNAEDQAKLRVIQIGQNPNAIIGYTITVVPKNIKTDDARVCIITESPGFETDNSSEVSFDVAYKNLEKWKELNDEALTYSDGVVTMLFGIKKSRKIVVRPQ